MSAQVTGAAFCAAGAAAGPVGKLVGKLVTIPANAPFAVAPAPKTINSIARASHNGLLLALECDIYLPCSLLWFKIRPIIASCGFEGVGRFEGSKVRTLLTFQHSNFSTFQPGIAPTRTTST